MTHVSKLDPCSNPQILPIPDDHKSIQKISYTKRVTPLCSRQGELNVFFRSEELLKAFSKESPVLGGTSFVRDWNEHEFQVIFIDDPYKRLEEAIGIIAKHFGIGLPQVVS